MTPLSRCRMDRIMASRKIPSCLAPAPNLCSAEQEMRKVRNAKAQGMSWFIDEVTWNKHFGTDWSK